MKQEEIYDHFEQLADKLNITILEGRGDFGALKSSVRIYFCTLALMDSRATNSYL